MPKGGRPDLQLFVMPLSVDKPGKPLHAFSGFTTSFWQCHPESRGSVRIASDDPMADPVIRTNYLSAGEGPEGHRGGHPAGPGAL